jgi:hypothetical protein
MFAQHRGAAYHCGMQMLGWTLIFTASSLEHLAEREIDADDVADAVLAVTDWLGFGAVDTESGRDGSSSRPWRTVTF